MDGLQVDHCHAVAMTDNLPHHLVHFTCRDSWGTHVHREGAGPRLGLVLGNMDLFSIPTTLQASIMIQPM